MYFYLLLNLITNHEYVEKYCSPLLRTSKHLLQKRRRKIVIKKIDKDRPGRSASLRAAPASSRKPANSPFSAASTPLPSSSPPGKVFSFGSPSVDAVVDRRSSQSGRPCREGGGGREDDGSGVVSTPARRSEKTRPARRLEKQICRAHALHRFLRFHHA